MAGLLPGASVTNKTTGKSTATDFKGGFNLTASPGDLLEIKSIGYLTKQLKIEDTNPLKIMLEQDNKSLSKVVGTNRL